MRSGIAAKGEKPFNATVKTKTAGAENTLDQTMNEIIPSHPVFWIDKAIR